MAIGSSRSGLRLDLRQSQSLVMTPQLRQAIKLLQSSNLEVAAFVEEELERNPLLERDERPEPAMEDGRRADVLPVLDNRDTAVIRVRRWRIGRCRCATRGRGTARGG
jgi:DNA-directed RNA polymerase specialized sigma54-like protein